MKVGRVFLSSAILLSFLLIIWRKNVFFGHLTSGIVLSEREDTSALSQEKWHSGMRGSYVSMHSHGRRILAARIPLYPNSSVHFNATRLVISGDVSPNPGPGGTRPNTNISQGPRFPFKAKGLRCCHLNMRSLPVQLDKVGTLILLNNLDVFAVSETWLNSTWNDHELNIQGYQLFRQDRKTTVASKAPHGGGVAIYAKSTLHCRSMTFTNETHMEHICLQLRQHKDGSKMLFIAMYRPPHSTADFFNDLTKFVKDGYPQYHEIIAVGDFNIDMLHNKRNRLKTIFSDAGFTQINNTATRVTKNSATLIDHVYTTHPNRVGEIIVPTHGMSDHYPVCFVHKYRGIKSGKFSHDEISYRNFKILNHNEFVADLDNAPWSLLDMFDDVNEKVDT